VKDEAYVNHARKAAADCAHRIAAAQSLIADLKP
jgi:hypothetical protein